MTILVENGYCYDDEFNSPIPIGSNLWFTWLVGHGSFRFECVHGNITVLKDNKGYWTASKKVDGKLRRTRLGRLMKVTESQLIAAAELLCVNVFWKEHQLHQVREKKETLSGVKEYARNLATRLEDARETIEALEGKLRAVSQKPSDTALKESVQTVLESYQLRVKDTRNWTQAKRLIEEIKEAIE